MSEILCILLIMYMSLTKIPYETSGSVGWWIAGCYALLITVAFIARNPFQSSKLCFQAIRPALLLKALGLLLGLPYKLDYSDFTASQIVAQENFQNILFDIAAFIVGAFFITKLNLYRTKTFGRFSLSVMPVCLFLARLTGKSVHGSYLSVFGILSFTVFMIFAPYAAAYSFCDTSIKNPLNRNLTALSGNELLYLFILMLTAILSGKVNHEYGLVLVFTGAVGGLLFILYGRSTFSKICLSCIAVWMAVLVTMTSTKVKTKIMVMNNLANAWDNGNLMGGEATQLYYFFLRVKGAGFYGFGSGQLSEKLYPTALNDYVFTTLIYNHGLLTGFLAFILASAMCRAILRSNITDRYDGIINQSIAIIFGAIYILSFFGCLGALPLSGISPLFISSTGHSMEIAGALLLGMAAGLSRKSTG